MSYNGPYTISIQTEQNRLYGREKDFKGFSLSREQLVNIKNNISHFNNRYGTNNKLNLYIKVLQFLNSPQANLVLKSFDEKLVFLIQTIDPNLEMYMEYANTEIIKKSEITKAKESKQQSLIKARNAQLQAFERKIREKFGFYDNKLISYEGKYLRTLKSSNKIVNNVKQDYTSSLLSKTSFVHDFSNVSVEEFKKINEKAQFYLTKAEDPKNINTLAFNLLTRNTFLYYRSIEELFALFIAIIDPNLDILRIYEEESLVKEVQRRISEEIGFYTEDLIRLEKEYHRHFCPEKKISDWTL